MLPHTGPRSRAFGCSGFLSVSVGVVVDFMLMTWVSVVMGTVLAHVIVSVSQRITRMIVFVFVLVQMVVRMHMGMLV